MSVLPVKILAFNTNILKCALEKFHTTETPALSRSWKKKPIAIRVSVSKYYVTFCGAAA
jgi:hypothetical protein